MELTRAEEAMLAGREGPAKQRAMEGLVQLGRAFGAPRMVEIGYAHIHPGMALYRDDVQLMEELAAMGAKMAVPASANVANADMINPHLSGAPENLVRLQRRAIGAHQQMGCATAFTCTPYWAGHWPTWNMHMTSIESTVTIFCNSVLGARSNRDGFFAVYAAITGRYPLFGLHLDDNRLGERLFRIETELEGTSDFTCLGFAIGELTGAELPVITGFARRPNLDELDALGAGVSASGGAAMFIVPGVTPPYADVAQAFGGRVPPEATIVGREIIDAVYARFCTGSPDEIDIIQLGCPHASFEEMKSYAALFAGRKVSNRSEVWITTSRAVRSRCQDEGLLKSIEDTGAKVIVDTCPMSCHLARTTSPDPALGLVPPRKRTILVDSAKQAKYVRDMICETLLTGTAEAVESAVSGRFVARGSRP
jgi:predicted aconitase